MFKMSLSNGAISDFYEVTGMVVVYHQIWDFKFLSDNIAWTVYDNDDYTFAFVNFFDSHKFYNFRGRNGLSHHGIGELNDGDTVAIIGGHSDCTQTLTVDFDYLEYFYEYFWAEDYLELSKVTNSSILALTSVTGPSNSLDNYTPTKVTDLGITALTPSAYDDDFYTGITVVNRNDDHETISVDIDYIGDSSQLTHVCYEPEDGNPATHQPAFSTLYIDDYSAYSGWLNFDTTSGFFTTNVAVEGSYDFTVGVVYTDVGGTDF